jgi:hypothetical protein
VLAAPAVTYDGVSESMQQGERLLDAIREATHARKQARPPILRRCAAEFAATGLIFFVGNALTALLATGAIASALTWGVVVAAAVASTVNLSGAHFNPSVTIAFAAGGKHPWAETPAYILAQVTPHTGTQDRITSHLLRSELKRAMSRRSLLVPPPPPPASR